MAKQFYNAEKYFWTGAILSAAILATGCSTRLTLTERSSVEQLLVVRSLERAVAEIDIDRFRGKRIAVDVYGLTADRVFAQELILARFRERGMRIASAPDEADLRLKILVNALGVDRGETLIGIPAFAAPVVNMPIPEIALFKWVRGRGNAEVDLFAFDQESGDFVFKSPVAAGEASYDDYTFLILIKFNLNDLDERPEDKTTAEP